MPGIFWQLTRVLSSSATSALIICLKVFTHSKVVLKHYDFNVESFMGNYILLMMVVLLYLKFACV